MQLLKHGRHYECQLQGHKKNMERLWNNNSTWLSWFVWQSDTLLLANILQNFQKKCIKIVKMCNKLVCNLLNKQNYALHVTTLKQVLNHGLKEYMK